MTNKLINSIFKILILSLFVISDLHWAYAQTAGILPNAMTTFVDQNGKPLSSGKVYFYGPGTTTPKTTWQDGSQTTVNTNPVVLDAAGRALIWGNGSYRQQVFDQFNNLQWDKVTAGAGSSSSGGIGDGLQVGTILPWSGLVPPANYQLAYGQAISRITFSALLAVLTFSTNITCTGGNAVISNIADTTSIPTGAILESTCSAVGARVLSKTSTTVTMSANSTISTTTTGTFFIYGNGDGSNTFNVPDTRGYVLAGRCNMGGVNCTNITSYFDVGNANNTANALGAKGGIQANQLVTANLPAYTPTGTINIVDPGHIHGISPIAATPVSGVAGSTSAGLAGNGASQTQSATTGLNSSNVTFAGAAQGGTQAPFTVIQPTETVNYIIKVTPDSNVGTASISQLQGGLPNKLTGTDANGIFGNVNLPTGLTLSTYNLNFVANSCAGSNWFNSISINGIFTCAQPSFTNISGSLACTQTPALTGNITTSAGSCVTTISTAAVTYAMIQNVAASRLLGNPTSIAGAPSEIPLDPTLSFSGTTLKCNIFTSTVAGCVPASGGGTTTYLRADGAFATPAGAGNVSGPGSSVANHTAIFNGITGTTIADSGLNYYGTTNIQTTNYTIATSDCGKTVEVGTGSTGYLTATLPTVVSGPFPEGCIVFIKNGDTAAGKKISGFPTGFGNSQAILWPTQSGAVQVINSAWQTVVSPGRWKTPGGVLNVFSDFTNGNDTNDCLAAGTGRACKTANHALYIACNEFDFVGSDGSQTQLTVNLAASTTDTTGIHYSCRSQLGAQGGAAIIIQGGGASVINGTGLDAIGVFTGAIVQVRALSLSSTTSGCITAALGAQVYALDGLVFGSCPGGHMAASDGGAIYVNNNYQINGNAPFHFYGVNGGRVETQATVVATLGASFTISQAFAFTGALGDVNVPNWTVNLNSFTVTGTRSSANAGVINTSNGTTACLNTYFPGTVNGTNNSTVNGGWCL